MPKQRRSLILKPREAQELQKAQRRVQNVERARVPVTTVTTRVIMSPKRKPNPATIPLQPQTQGTPTSLSRYSLDIFVAAFNTDTLLYDFYYLQSDNTWVVEFTGGDGLDIKNWINSKYVWLWNTNSSRMLYSLDRGETFLQSLILELIADNGPIDKFGRAYVSYNNNLAYTNNGVTYTNLATGEIYNVMLSDLNPDNLAYTVAPSGTTRIYASGDRGVTFAFEEILNVENPLQDISLFWLDDRLIAVYTEDAYGGTREFKSIYSDNFGETWSNEVIVGDYAGLPQMRGHDNTLWCNFRSAAGMSDVARSNSRGAGWTRITGGPSITGLCRNTPPAYSTAKNRLYTIFETTTGNRQLYYLANPKVVTTGWTLDANAPDQVAELGIISNKYLNA